MSISAISTGHTSAGQKALHKHLALTGPEPATRSRIGQFSRRTVEYRSYVDEYYSLRYETGNSLVENLRFALKFEPLPTPPCPGW